MPRRTDPSESSQRCIFNLRLQEVEMDLSPVATGGTKNDSSVGPASRFCFQLLDTRF